MNTNHSHTENSAKFRTQTPVVLYSLHNEKGIAIPDSFSGFVGDENHGAVALAAGFLKINKDGGVNLKDVILCETSYQLTDKDMLDMLNIGIVRAVSRGFFPKSALKNNTAAKRIFIKTQKAAAEPPLKDRSYNECHRG